MRSPQTALRWALGTAFCVIVGLFWALTIVSAWVVRDSYALDAFLKAHPVAGALVEFFWVAFDYDGTFILALVLSGIFYGLAFRPFRKER